MKHLILIATFSLMCFCRSAIGQSYIKLKNISHNDSVKYSNQIKTSFNLLRLIQTNQRDSIINFYVNNHWVKFYNYNAKLYSSSIDDALTLIKNFGMPTLEQVSIQKTTSGEKKTEDFPDKYGIAIRFNLAPKIYRKNYGLIEFYFTEEQFDKVCVIFSSDPKKGRKL